MFYPIKQVRRSHENMRIFSNLLPSDLDVELCDDELDDLELELDDESRRRTFRSPDGERERDL